MATILRLGQIVKIHNCPDPQGGNHDTRRFIVLSINESLNEFIGVGVSGQYSKNNRYHVQQDPNPKNQLDKRSAAICDTWIVVWKISDISVLQAGYCHPPSWLKAILEAVRHHPLLSKPQPPVDNTESPSSPIPPPPPSVPTVE